jgi:STAS-like domain of unknown function (DUF4325)
MVRIPVLELVGSVCVDPEDGEVLCQRAREVLLRGESVTLDFTGIVALTSSFLNSAVGCLLATFSAETVREKLSWCALDPADEELVSLVLKNASRFYSATPSARQALASASDSIVEE